MNTILDFLNRQYDICQEFDEGVDYFKEKCEQCGYKFVNKEMIFCTSDNRQLCIKCYYKEKK